MNDVEWRASDDVDGASETLDFDDYYRDEAATLGDRIAAARQAAGLSQADLAARLGVGAKVVTSWENDRSEPRANRLSMLAGMLNVSVAWLLTGGGDGVAPPEERATARDDLRPLLLTVVVDDLEQARQFYGDALGCACAVASDKSQEVDFFGHRLRLVLADSAKLVTGPEGGATNGGVANGDATEGGGATSSASRFGVELSWTQWRSLVERVRAQILDFVEEPMIEAVGAPEERGAFRLRDPSGNEVAFEARRSAELA